jgi:hypothetical protein
VTDSAATTRSGPSITSRQRTRRTVRGSWATADLIAPSRLRFFLGLLDEPLTPEQAGAPRRRREASAQQDDNQIQVAATGRIIAVVARDATQDPDWAQVISRIE